jgi:phosphoribosylanthranilate isomerase
MKIKVCGLKYPDNVLAVSALQPDFVGFVFYGPSPRYAAQMSAETMQQIPPEIIKTAVFVNETSAQIARLVDEYQFDAVQLHGSEDVDFCNGLRNKAIIIKAFGINDQFDFRRLDAYAGSVDYFLFDTKTVIHGGSGESFDWSLLNKYDLDIPFFLSGGISLDNLAEIQHIDHPMLFGVDLNSRFETAPGLKNITRLEKAFNLIKQTANEIRR